MRSGKRIVVVGSGISGLSLTYHLQRLLPQHVQLTLLEAKDRVGGWIDSTTTKTNPGFLFENGPRGFRPSRNGQATLELIESLGIQDQMQVVDSSASIRYIFMNQQVTKVPTKVSELLQWPMTGPILRALAKEPFVPPTSKPDESVYDFISRRFNKEVAENLLDPMASGIYGGDIKELSIQSTFNILWQMEKASGSIVKHMLKNVINPPPKAIAPSPFVEQNQAKLSISFEKGMETLPLALRQSLEEADNVEIRMNSEVKQLASREGKCLIDVQGGSESIEADHVFSTIPAAPLSHALASSAPAAHELLQSFSSVSMAVVHIGYDSDLMVNCPGFGYLVPSTAGEKILGVVYDSNAFPGQNRSSTAQTRLSVMIGGAHHPWVQTASLETLQEIALDAIQRHLQISKTPSYVYTQVLKDCIPQYKVGHATKLATVRELLANEMPNIEITGNNFDGIGVSDCIAASKQLAHDFAQHYRKQL